MLKTLEKKGLEWTSYPGMAIISTLLWWLVVARGPVVGDQEELVILRGYNWIGDVLASYPGLLLRPWLGGGVFIERS